MSNSCCWRARGREWIGAWAAIVVGAWGAAGPTGAARAADAVFEPFSTEYAITTLAATEDGLTLVLGHENDDKLTVWDVVSGKKTFEVDCERPRSILPRGNKAYVANYGLGTISVFDMAAKWDLADELKAGHKHPVYLSAPGGQAFKNMLLAVCAEDRSHGRELILVDAAKDKFFSFDNMIYGSIANIDFEGKYVVSQNTVGHSISGNIAGAYDLKILLAGQKTRPQGARWENAAPLHQVGPGGYWFGGNQVWRGTPPAPLRIESPDSVTVVPDRGRKVFYDLTKDALRCRALDAKFTELGSRPVKYPAGWERMKNGPQWPYRVQGGTVFFQHLAVTVDDTLRLFVLEESNNVLYHCKTEAFGAALATGDLATGDPLKGDPAAPSTEPLAAVDVFPEQLPMGRKFTFTLPKAEGAAYELINPPGGVTLSAGEIAWTPGRDDAGEQTIKVKARVGDKTEILRFVTNVVPAAGVTAPRTTHTRPTPAGEPSESPEALGDLEPLPELVASGQRLQHKLYDAPVKDAVFEIVDGPASAKISAAGVLDWTPTAAEAGLHNFKIKLTIGGKPSFVRLAASVVDVTGLTLESHDPDTLAKIGVLELAGPTPFVASGLGGDSVLVLEGDTLRVLDAGGVATRKRVELERRYKAIFERPRHYVALSDSSVDLLDKTTLKPVQEIILDHSQVGTLAIHPTREISYVTADLGSSSDVDPDDEEVFTKKPVLEVNEATGKARALKGVYGSWVATEPSGQYLFTGVSQIYKAGIGFNSVVGVTQEWGHVDALTAFDIRAAEPRKLGENKTPGRNGSRIVVSPDGRYVAYVSAAGIQALPYEVPAFAVPNVNAVYAHYKIDGFCRDVAFHPTLELAASINQNGVELAMFKLKSGKKVAEHLDGERKFKGLDRVWFSPDGKRLLVRHEHPHMGHVLESVALRLSDEERQRVEQGRGAVKPAGEPEPPGQGGPRVWTSADGRFKIEAALVGVTADGVVLRRADGQQVTVPLAKLSEADRRYLNQRK